MYLVWICHSFSQARIFEGKIGAAERIDPSPPYTPAHSTLQSEMIKLEAVISTETNIRFNAVP